MIKETAEGVLFNIKVVPNSSKNCFFKENDFYKLKITAQPIENKANKAVIEFLSKFLKIPKKNCLIVKGLSSKEKVILLKISNLDKRKEIVLKLKNEEVL